MHMTTGTPFDDGLGALGTARADVLAEVRPLDPVQVRFAPGPGRWSIAQVVEHLVLAEEAALRGLQSPRPVPDRGLAAAATLRLAVVKRVLASRLVKARAPSRALLPEGVATVDALERRWLEAGAGHEAFLRDLPPPRRGERLFRHPVSGWLSLHQMLDFLGFHVRHHQRQVRAIRRAAGFPRG
jgi:hypothetical protein